MQPVKHPQTVSVPKPFIVLFQDRPFFALKVGETKFVGEF